MNFLDTAKDSTAATLNTVSAKINHEVHTYQTAYIIIFSVVVLTVVAAAAGYFVGFGQGVLSK